ncbi:hypothetical protein SLEP1_g9475 [Rubroshorea leprosula]|uniref:Uncharacterized protein n=1 Tax=Rubroshorea leprosula TaxID=152421 RepID=A0AAV5ICZ8_9ROSI|nr:hypothetical protein SLEP1_g9475 [Rubroshorea leprosula]
MDHFTCIKYVVRRECHCYHSIKGFIAIICMSILTHRLRLRSAYLSLSTKGGV